MVQFISRRPLKPISKPTPTPKPVPKPPSYLPTKPPSYLPIKPPSIFPVPTPKPAPKPPTYTPWKPPVPIPKPVPQPTPKPIPKPPSYTPPPFTSPPPTFTPWTSPQQPSTNIPQTPSTSTPWTPPVSSSDVSDPSTDQSIVPPAQPILPVLNNAVSPSTVDRTAPTVDNTTSQIASEADNFYSKLMAGLLTPDEEQNVRKKYLDSIQPYVDLMGTNTSFLLAERERATQEMLGSNRAINARSGNIGSMKEIKTIEDINKYNIEQKKNIQNEQATKIEEARQSMLKMAEDRINLQRSESIAAAGAKTTLAETTAMGKANRERIATDIVNTKANIAATNQALKDKVKSNALENIKLLGRSNIALGQIPSDVFKAIVDATGFAGGMIEMMLNTERDAAHKIDYNYQLVNGQLQGMGQDPITGKPVFSEMPAPKWMQNYKKPVVEITSKGTIVTHDVDFNGNPIEGSWRYDTSMFEFITDKEATTKAKSEYYFNADAESQKTIQWLKLQYPNATDFNRELEKYTGSKEGRSAYDTMYQKWVADPANKKALDKMFIGE